MATYLISELSERAGVPATTLRYYERAGLLPAARSANGYRRYGEDALDRLALIRAGQHLGLPLAQIRALLTARDGGACADVRDQLRPLLTAQIAQARARAATLAGSIVRLEQALSATAPDPAPGPCHPTCGCLTTPGPRPTGTARAGTARPTGTARAGTPRPTDTSRPTDLPNPTDIPRVGTPRPISTVDPISTSCPTSIRRADNSKKTRRPPEAALSPQPPPQQPPPSQRKLPARQTHPPIVCTLDGDGQEARLAEWRELFRRATDRETVADGVRVALPAALAGLVAELAAAEQRCCPFFRFTLVFDGSEVHLTVQAPADAGSLLAQLTDEPGPSGSLYTV